MQTEARVRDGQTLVSEVMAGFPGPAIPGLDPLERIIVATQLELLRARDYPGSPVSDEERTNADEEFAAILSQATGEDPNRIQWLFDLAATLNS